MAQNIPSPTPAQRLQEKNELMFKLGGLLNPLIHLAQNPQLYDEQERAETIARYCAEYPKLQQQFQRFSVGQAGHNYLVEYNRFYNALSSVSHWLIGASKSLDDILSENVPIAQAAISAVPIPRDSTIFEAATPFSTYCALKDLFEADTNSELIWVDAYMNSNVFHRFLRDVNMNAPITLVTNAPRANAGNNERPRWNEFLDISRLYAQERGANYRLIVHTTLHDRWLLIDQKRLYSLGGSAKDAGNKQYFTLARLDALPASIQAVQAHISGGTEYFGPSTPTHQ